MAASIASPAGLSIAPERIPSRLPSQAAAARGQPDSTAELAHQARCVSTRPMDRMQHVLRQADGLPRPAEPGPEQQAGSARLSGTTRCALDVTRAPQHAIVPAGNRVWGAGR